SVCGAPPSCWGCAGSTAGTGTGRGALACAGAPAAGAGGAAAVAGAALYTTTYHHVRPNVPTTSITGTSTARTFLTMTWYGWPSARGRTAAAMRPGTTLRRPA